MKVVNTTAGRISFRKAAGRGYSATMHHVRNQCGSKVHVRVVQSRLLTWRWFSRGTTSACGDDVGSKAIFPTAKDAWVDFCRTQLPTYTQVELAVSAEDLIG